MTDAVKRRRYDSSRRLAMTRATKADVVDAACTLFLEHGYTATTVSQIAERAQTPLATVYRLFGTKRGILKELLDVTLGGDDEPIEFQHRPEVRAALAHSEPGRVLDAFAHIIRGVQHRSAALQIVLAESAAADSEAAEMLQVTRLQRHAGQARIARALAGDGALRAGVSQAEAADIIYTLMSPEVFRILTVERGWSGGRYERWLASTLRSQLLAEDRS